MWKLIKLEWKKNHIGKYVRNAAIMAGVLGLFLFALAFFGIADDPVTGVPDAASENEMMSAFIELFTSMAFLVFTSVMLSSSIISAYRNKTMGLMFSYPIKRQKILVSGMLAVWIFNFAALVLTKVLIYGCIFWTSRRRASSFSVDYDMTSPDFYAQLIVKSIVTVTMSFITLFIGMVKKSSKAAIISSFLLIVLTQGNIGDLTLANNMALPVVLTAVSLLLAFLAVCKAETRDLM